MYAPLVVNSLVSWVMEVALERENGDHDEASGGGDKLLLVSSRVTWQ